MHFAQHIYATCWQKDAKELEHPECPYARAWQDSIIPRSAQNKRLVEELFFPNICEFSESSKFNSHITSINESLS